MAGRWRIHIVAICCLTLPVFSLNNVELVEWVLKYGEDVQILEPKHSFADSKYKDDTVLQINPNETETSNIVAIIQRHLAKKKNTVPEAGGSSNTPSDPNHLLRLLSKVNVRADSMKPSSVDDILTRLRDSMTKEKEELDNTDTYEHPTKEDDYLEEKYPFDAFFDETPGDDEGTGRAKIEDPNEYSNLEQEAEQSTVGDTDKENADRVGMVGYYHHYYHHYHHYYHHYHSYHPYHYHHYHHHPVVYRGRQHRYCHNTGSYYRYCCVSQWFRVHFYSHYYHGLRFRLRACLGARKRYYRPYYYNVLTYKVNGHTLLTRYKRYYADSSYHHCFRYGKTYTCLKLYRSGSKYQCAKVSGWLTLVGYKISLHAYMGCVHLPYMSTEEEIEDTFGKYRSGELAATESEADTFGQNIEAFERSLNSGPDFDQTHTPLEYEAVPREPGRMKPLRMIEENQVPGDRLQSEYHAIKSGNHRFSNLEPKRKLADEMTNPELSKMSPFEGAWTDEIEEAYQEQNDGGTRG